MNYEVRVRWEGTSGALSIFVPNNVSLLGLRKMVYGVLHHPMSEPLEITFKDHGTPRELRTEEDVKRLIELAMDSRQAVLLLVRNAPAARTVSTPVAQATNALNTSTVTPPSSSAAPARYDYPNLVQNQPTDNANTTAPAARTVSTPNTQATSALNSSTIAPPSRSAAPARQSEPDDLDDIAKLWKLLVTMGVVKSDLVRRMKDAQTKAKKAGHDGVLQEALFSDRCQRLLGDLCLAWVEEAEALADPKKPDESILNSIVIDPLKPTKGEVVGDGNCCLNVKPGSDAPVAFWRVRNTGSVKWDKTRLELCQISGTRLQSESQVIPEPEPNGVKNLTFQPVIPSTEQRSFVSVWELREKDKVYPPVMTGLRLTINIEAPNPTPNPIPNPTPNPTPNPYQLQPWQQPHPQPEPKPEPKPQPKPQPKPKPDPEPPVYPTVKPRSVYQAQHVGDMTLTTQGGDATVANGKSRVKVWRVRNPGKDAWPTGCRVCLVDGGGAYSVQYEALGVGTAAPGGVAEVAVSLTVPFMLGRWMSRWMLVDPDGRAMMDTPLVLDISVVPGVDTSEHEFLQEAWKETQ